MDQATSLNPLIDQSVTWLIVVKNGMPYIRETLESIEKQTYRNWQVLVWDNGSTDGTLEEIQRWIPERLKGTVFTGKSLSVGDSRAELIKQCSTELCAIIDADDICEPNRLQVQVEFLLAHPEIAVLGSQMSRIDRSGHLLDDSLYQVPLEYSDILYSTLWRCPLAQPTVLLRRSAVLAAGNYRYCPDWQGVNAEDYDLWLRMLGKGFKFINLAAPLVQYRVHDRSSTARSAQAGKLGQVTQLIRRQNAQEAFGCNAFEFERLSNRQLHLALPSIYKISKHFKKKLNVSILSLFLDSRFLTSVDQFIHPYDYLSRLIIVILQKKPKTLLKELVEILKLSYLRVKIFARLTS